MSPNRTFYKIPVLRSPATVRGPLPHPSLFTSDPLEVGVLVQTRGHSDRSVRDPTKRGGNNRDEVSG